MVSYDGWDRDYQENKEAYAKIFDQVMNRGEYEDTSHFEKSFENFTNRKHIVSVSNATEALRFSLMALGIKEGDEVLVSDFSWISTSSCISMVGATPVFCDIDLENYHISLESLKRMVSPNTKAIIYTHLFGNMSDCTPIIDFCKENGIAFIEDAAQSFGSSYRKLAAGELGDCSSFSFNSNKVIAGINGGGVFLTDNSQLAKSVRLLRRHGKEKDFASLGFNSRMYTLNSEIILHRLARWETLQKKRQQIAKTYDNAFKNSAVIFQPSKPGLVHNYHKYTIRLQDKDTRKKVKNALSGSIHYERPLSTNSMYESISHRKDNCENSKIVADTILSLPVHPWLTKEEIEHVCEIVISTSGKKKKSFWPQIFS